MGENEIDTIRIEVGIALQRGVDGKEGKRGKVLRMKNREGHRVAEGTYLGHTPGFELASPKHYLQPTPSLHLVNCGISLALEINY